MFYRDFIAFDHMELQDMNYGLSISLQAVAIFFFILLWRDTATNQIKSSFHLSIFDEYGISLIIIAILLSVCHTYIKTVYNGVSI